MRINFFEEYPTNENLEKARLITFLSTIFLAANSLTEFYDCRDKLLSINSNLGAAYWPILPRSYWISPFSYTKDLKKFIEEMKTNKNPLTILIDLELPLVKNRSLYFRNFLDFMKECNFKTATIFRLGGLTQDYIKVIKNYLNT